MKQFQALEILGTYLPVYHCLQNMYACKVYIIHLYYITVLLTNKPFSSSSYKEPRNIMIYHLFAIPKTMYNKMINLRISPYKCV